MSNWGVKRVLWYIFGLTVLAIIAFVIALIFILAINTDYDARDEKRKEVERLEKLNEQRYEQLVLKYKGIDGKGFTIKDFSDARCGDNQRSFAQYLGDEFDGKYGYHHIMVHSPVNLDWNPPCLGAGWHFGVNTKGDVIAWDKSSERQAILDYLDSQG